MKALLIGAMLLLATPALANCPGWIFCDYHNQAAYYVRDEWPNGKRYRVFAHDNPPHEIVVPCR